MKTVVITGGSRGIGAAAVKSFAARGDRVYSFTRRSMPQPTPLPGKPAPLPSAAM